MSCLYSSVTRLNFNELYYLIALHCFDDSLEHKIMIDWSNTGTEEVDMFMERVLTVRYDLFYVV